MMDWNALRTFLAIARHGSLAGAARELNVNHSTIFRRINTFEEQIGNRLFDRLSEGYQLTQAGEELLARGENISNAFDNLERHIAGGNFKPKGLVTVTAPDNIAYRFLPGYLAAFRAIYPDINVDLLVSNVDFNLNRREADIAIRTTVNPPEHLVGRKISNIPWGVYASDCYLSDKALPDSACSLEGHRLIGATAVMNSLPAFSWLDKHHGKNIVARCSDLVSMSFMAESGYGLAFLPDDQNRPGLNRLCSFSPGKYSHLWLLTHPDSRQVERIKLLVDFLRQTFKEDARLDFTI
jgi:molybdate transport repressor ModE-like protein